MKFQNKKLTVALSVIYLGTLVWIILFKMDFHLFRQPRSINLIPFGGSLITNGQLDISEIIDNILIFVPCGMYSCMLLKGRSFLQRTFPAFAISLALELSQLLLAVGAFDITDLIDNTLGGIIGIGVYALLEKLFQKRTDSIINFLALTGTTLMLLFIGLILVANA